MICINANASYSEHAVPSIAAVICGDTEFRCVDGSACIPDDLQCDGNTDCADGSDELFANCSKLATFYCLLHVMVLF